MPTVRPMHVEKVCLEFLCPSVVEGIPKVRCQKGSANLLHIEVLLLQ